VFVVIVVLDDDDDDKENKHAVGYSHPYC